MASLLFLSLHYTALNNPIYELESIDGSNSYSLMGGQAGHQITASVESSPLYSSKGAGSSDVIERSQFIENKSLLGVLNSLPRSKSQQPIAPPANGTEGRGFGDRSISRSAMNIAENQDASGNTIVVVNVDPYGSYADDVSFPRETATDIAAEDDGDYVPMAPPESELFDDPDYDNVPY